MKKNGRFYNCIYCSRQVTICRDCDRGNTYCSPACSRTARKKSLAEAGQRYQQTPRGKINHAARQKRYRQRKQNKIVTHQGSPTDSTSDLLCHEQTETSKTHTEHAKPNQICCRFCNKTLSRFIRLDFLHRASPVQYQKSINWPQGP